MEHNRKHKLLIIIALVLGIASLSVGFAAFSVTLNISSQASVTPSSDTFSVKFSSTKPDIVDGEFSATSISEGATATKGLIDNSMSPSVKNLGATFTKPGQSVVYTIYIRNVGEYTAYLNSVNFLGEKTCVGEVGTTDSLVQSACQSISMHAVINSSTYTETKSVTEVAMAPIGSWIVAKIYLTYDSAGSYVDGPFSVTFPQLSLVFSSVDDPSIEPKIVQLESGDLNTTGSIVGIGNEKFYVIGQEDENVKLLSMYNLYVGNMVVIDDNEERHGTPLVNPTGIQDKTAVGGLYENYKPKGLWIGTTAFSDIGPTYSGSIIEGYVNNYALYLSGLGVHIDEARLISDEELYSFGCEGLSCFDAPEWVYSTTYWTGSIDNMNCLRTVYSDKVFGNSQYYEALEYGVRPVIEIPLSEF